MWSGRRGYPPEGVSAPGCRLGCARPHLRAQRKAPSSAQVPGEGTVTQPPLTLGVLVASRSHPVRLEFEEVATLVSLSLKTVLGSKSPTPDLARALAKLSFCVLAWFSCSPHSLPCGASSAEGGESALVVTSALEPQKLLSPVRLS